MSYEAKVLADSISDAGIRLTTLQVTFPRFILAEVNTHRMLSRNSASSRAIPPEKLIERVRTDPFVPETFNQRVKGMGVGDPLGRGEALVSIQSWRRAALNAVEEAMVLNDLGVDKSRVNRLLEPFLWHTAILTATEWSNFFALRCHPDAQPEMRITAELMRDAMGASQPRQLTPQEWHAPLVSGGVATNGFYAEVSAGRCARVSFDRHDETEPPDQSRGRALRLKQKGHLSPLEHVARPMDELEWAVVRDSREAAIERAESYGKKLDGLDAYEFVGNLRGWVQLRKYVPNEADFGRVLEEAVA